MPDAKILKLSDADFEAQVKAEPLLVVDCIGDVVERLVWVVC
jgi:hypothetical protein